MADDEEEEEVDEGTRWRPKLVLHVDLNNTVVVADSVTSQGPEEALANFLRLRLEEGEPLSSDPVVAPLLEEWGALGGTEAVVRSAVKRLEWSHGDDPKLTLPGGGEGGTRRPRGRPCHLLLPGFLELLCWLARQRPGFGLVLRTFGTDLEAALGAVRHALDGHHPDFPQLAQRRVDVAVQVGSMCPGPRGVTLSMEGTSVNSWEDGRAPYRVLSALVGVHGLQDDFRWWARHGFTSEGGKPLWVDPFDPSVHHIFIDDNIRPDDGNTIVNPQVFAGPGSARCSPVPTASLLGVCLVRTDLLAAIVDRTWFVRSVEACERAHVRSLRARGGPAPPATTGFPLRPRSRGAPPVADEDERVVRDCARGPV